MLLMCVIIIIIVNCIYSVMLTNLALRLLGGFTLSMALVGCGGGGSNSSVNAMPGMSELAQVGKLIFHDASLSQKGKQACASCHVADVGHAGALRAAGGTSDLAVELGADGASLGGRVAPSLRYLATNQSFHFAADGTPTGGFFWDGRAASLAEQAKGPFLNPLEMANADAAEVINKLKATTYASRFQSLFGADVFNDPQQAFERVALALQAYQKEDPDFAPYSSKYDAYLRGKTQLDAKELRGLVAFNSPSKGNCAACHPSAMTAAGTLPLFTDFSYDVLGVPRNWALPSTAWRDLGLCASAALDSVTISESAKSALCGAFKVPSLRNVGLRKAYFHNGRFTTLTDVVNFYVKRDISPELFYLTASGATDVKFNDLPDYAANVNVTEAPYNRHPGDAPALTDDEIADVVAFLCTLTDGWSATTVPACNR